MATPTKVAKPKLTPEQREAVKRERFLKLAEKRTNNALAALRRLSNLGGPGYSYSPNEAEQIIQAVVTAARTMADALRREKAARESFSLNITGASTPE